MKKIILLNKKEGETPLQALERFRLKNKEYLDVPMTYAGRLDPMASGLMLVLAGEEVKNKEKYLALPKEYEFSVLFGFATDTFDILGKPNMSGSLKVQGSPLHPKKVKGPPYTLPPYTLSTAKELLSQVITENLKFFMGKFEQKYPNYSSKTVRGRPLFDYARKGEAVDAPTREVVVKELKFLKWRRVRGKNLLKNIEKRIKKVEGDFRQPEILNLWRRKLSADDSFYAVVDFKIKCGSGTYVRAIANGLGERIGVPALAYTIKRTRIGKWYRMR